MAAPTSYTETALKLYMIDILGAVHTALGWTVDSNQYDEAVSETLLAYDVSAIADATEIRKLRTLARREAWRQAMYETALDYDLSKEGDSSSRSQMHTQAKAMFDLAATEAMIYDAEGYEAVIEDVEYGDPYKPLDEDE